MPLLKRSKKDARKAVSEWWNKPEHLDRRNAVTADDDVDDPKHQEPPRGIESDWYETAYGWVRKGEEKEDA